MIQLISSLVEAPLPLEGWETLEIVEHTHTAEKWNPGLSFFVFHTAYNLPRIYNLHCAFLNTVLTFLFAYLYAVSMKAERDLFK